MIYLYISAWQNDQSGVKPSRPHCPGPSQRVYTHTLMVWHLWLGANVPNGPRRMRESNPWPHVLSGRDISIYHTASTDWARDSGSVGRGSVIYLYISDGLLKSSRSLWPGLSQRVCTHSRSLRSLVGVWHLWLAADVPNNLHPLVSNPWPHVFWLTW